MPDQLPEIEGLSIVLVGSFNPKIFHPAWFAAEKLIRKEEEAAAKLEITHPEIAVFALEWAKIQVTQDRFIAETSTEKRYEIELLRDIVLGTFTLLRHTPVRALGINRDFHFELPTDEAWHQVGDKLAPKELWSGILSGRPGMRSLLMEGTRPDALKGYVHVAVEPSFKIKQPKRGVYFRINDHFAKQKDGESQPASDFADILRNVWSDSLEMSRKIAYTVLERTK